MTSAAGTRLAAVLAVQGRPWFGRILQWQRESERQYSDSWAARYQGRLYEMVKLTRRQADEAHTEAGWVLTDSPDLPVDSRHNRWPGPALGRTIGSARFAAEFTILTPAADRRWHGDQDGTPSIHITFGGARLPTASGIPVTAWVDHTARAFLVRRSESYPNTAEGELLGAVIPRFEIPDCGPELEAVRLSWIPMAGDQQLPECASWHEACQALKDHL